MNPKYVILTLAGAIVVGLGLWVGFYPVDWQGWLGFTKADYFTLGQNYALYSGFLPCLLTSVGMSTIIGGLWHTHNCHEDGCWRIGKHKVNGTPWCNAHHEAARHVKTAEQLLEEQNDILLQRVVALLEAQNELLAAR